MPTGAAVDDVASEKTEVRRVIDAFRRAVNAPHLVALVRGGARGERGLLVEREATA